MVTKSRRGLHRSMNDSRSAVPVLADLVQPPVGHPWVVDWRAVETKLGSGLPSDYKEYVTRFGPGFLEKDYIRIAMPGIPDEWGRNYEFSTTSGSEVYDCARAVKESCIRSGLSRVACSRGGDLLCGHVLLGHVSKTSGQVDGCRVHSRTIRMVQLRRQHESIPGCAADTTDHRSFLVADLGAPPRPFEPDDRRRL